MPVIDGQKYACESCVKGHRVSNCNHLERELKLIAPKGRPVKQCDHCRIARKSKSHHAKCDCGSKREKKESKADLRKEDSGCCCHKGEQCLCGNKNDHIGTRMEKVLSRPTPSVKAKPRLTTSTSDPKLSLFTNGHPPTVHRNNLAHTSGVPYKIPRPHSLHGTPAFMNGNRKQESVDADSRAMDDLFELNSNKLYSLSSSGTTSQESLRLAKSEYPSELSPLDAEHLSSVSPDSFEDVSLDARFGQDFGWIETPLTTLSEDAYASLTTSPNFSADFDWSAVPSTSSEFFMPSDLPLVSPQVSSFAQTISHSDESNYAPGLTNGSSGAQSDNELEGFWKDTIQVRRAAGDRWPSSLGDEYAFGSHSQGTDRYSTSGASQSRHLSDSSTTTAFHLGSLGTMPETEDNDNAIVIPSGNETDEWAWQSSVGSLPQTGDVAKEYGWLLDS